MSRSDDASAGLSGLLESEVECESMTVTVLGGCGFLGQHLVRLLDTYGTNVSLIRVLDFYTFIRDLNYQPTRQVESIIGSITYMEDVLVATAGATTVFHLASYSDRSMFPDPKLYNLINVEGTNTVIKACQQNGVRNLIYASDISAVMGQSSIIRGDESSTNYPRVHMLPDGPSKAEAEKMILAACGIPVKGDPIDEGTTRMGLGLLQDGSPGSTATLKTLVLRLVNLYGELDSFLWPRLISLASSNYGDVPCVGNMKNKVNMMYVGNAAWAFICAHNSLTHTEILDPSQIVLEHSDDSVSMSTTITSIRSPREPSSKKKPHKLRWKDVKPSNTPSNTPEETTSLSDSAPFDSEVFKEKEPIEGKVFLVTDNTPAANYFIFMSYFLRRYGFFLTSWSLPEKWAKRLAKVVYVVLWLLFPVIHINPQFCIGDIHVLCRHYTFSSKLAQSQIPYSPLFTFKKALKHTVRFYDRVYKEALSECLFTRALGSQHLSIVRCISQAKRDIQSIDLGNTGCRYRRKGLFSKIA